MRLELKHLLVFTGLSVVFLFTACHQAKTPRIHYLHEGWELINPLTNNSIAATVPGNVYTDLLAEHIIPDPFFGTNEDSVKWVAEQAWMYRTMFDLKSDQLDCEQVELVFEGLDTYTEVFLNDILILKSDNMFRSYQLDVKHRLKKGQNKLEILFRPADSMNMIRAAQLPFLLPEKRVHSRKAPYQFGWDWGPALPTMGIWKPIKIVGWSKAKIDNYTIHQLKVDSIQAKLRLEVEVSSNINQRFRLQLQHQGKMLIEQAVQLEEGLNRLHLPFSIEQPELWWPNGMGDQHLYMFELHLVHGRQLLDSCQLFTGLRHIELVTEPDHIGESFFFKVNGKPVFIKGANYIPEDSFVNQKNRNNTRKLLSDAASVHMNMIRVWGGGVYPDDHFYEIADSLGLMIWQDFMFACSMYPFDEAFLDNVRQEAMQQIKRIRKHPSLAIWCGNNEVSEGFHNWGWQQSLSWTDEDEELIWQGYTSLFEKLLPDLVQEYDPQRPYWPSSPSTGWGRPESLLKGDVHYWGVWWGEEPFDMYEERVGRFHSEYGFQAMPHLATIEAFTFPEARYIGSEVLESHQKHPRGTRLIQTYMQHDFPLPSKLEDYVYVSQLVQAYGIQKAIHAHRRALPYCMGTLYWQLNDCWPGISWSSIDYYGRWKALHYKLKEAFNPLLISFEIRDDSLMIFLVNDGIVSFQGRMGLDLKDFTGQTLFAFSEPVVVDGQTVQLIESKQISSLLQGVDKQSVMLYTSLLNENRIITEASYFFSAARDLKLVPIKPELKMTVIDNHIEITLYSDQLIKSLMLKSNDPNGFFKDNFFDLMPGKEKLVQFVPSGEVPFNQLVFESLSLNEVKNRR